MARHGAQFRIDLDSLREALGLPEEARVVKVLVDSTREFFEKSVSVVVEHPDLPEMVEGARIPEVVPVFRGGKLVDWGM